MAGMGRLVRMNFRVNVAKYREVLVENLHLRLGEGLLLT